MSVQNKHQSKTKIHKNKFEMFKGKALAYSYAGSKQKVKPMIQYVVIE